MTIVNDTFKIALDCVYWDANLVAYQINPEVFEWETMYNNKIRPHELEVDERLAPFMMISFDYGKPHQLINLTHTNPMMILKIRQEKTSSYHELISYN